MPSCHRLWAFHLFAMLSSADLHCNPITAAGWPLSLLSSVKVGENHVVLGLSERETIYEGEHALVLRGKCVRANMRWNLGQTVPARAGDPAADRLHTDVLNSMRSGVWMLCKDCASSYDPCKQSKKQRDIELTYQCTGTLKTTGTCRCLKAAYMSLPTSDTASLLVSEALQQFSSLYRPACTSFPCVSGRSFGFPRLVPSARLLPISVMSAWHLRSLSTL
jgi:hypothetical protein